MKYRELKSECRNELAVVECQIARAKRLKLNECLDALRAKEAVLIKVLAAKWIPETKRI